ncbi:LCP family protein [Ruminococcus sp.]|uniref:LCP family protein n=1 Tax=Ruminococcus sp. TaxID=41978 RepID=UPI0025EAEEE4|nr:LCP family protein [Ruminococcus sp.]MBQ8966662.1 LCP family protein [Ruminococcus sp.]
MDNNKFNSRPVDPYEEQYQRQLEQFSRMAGDKGGDIDLSMGSIDDAFAGEYEQYDESPQYGGQQSYGQQRPRPQQPPRRGQAAPQQRQAPSRKRSAAPKKTRPAVRKQRRTFAESTPRREAPKKSATKNTAKRRSKPVKYEKRYDPEELQFGGHTSSEAPEYRKSHPVRSFFRTVIILLLVMFIGLNGLLYYYISLVDQRGRGVRTYTSGALESSDLTNILLIGSDTRDKNEYGRTDSMILLSVNKSKKTVTMTSFMRDMYVEIKGRNTNGEDVDFWDKLNSAYVHGGAELLMDTIEYNFDISVDDYVYIDFFAFIDIVDALGGIELDVSDEEAAGMEPPQREQNKILGQPGSTDLLTHGGKNMTLNGNQALAYARLRYVGNADFERTDRQRKVISKIISKVKGSNPLVINKFANAAFSHLSTNMSRADMMFMAYKALFSVNYEIKSLRLPAEGSYGYGDHNGQSTLDVDLEACRSLLRHEIYE